MKTIPKDIKSGMTVYMVMPCPYIKENIGIEETRLRAASYAPNLECSYDSFFDGVVLQKKNWMDGEQIYFDKDEAFAYAQVKYPNKNYVDVKYREPSIKQFSKEELPIKSNFNYDYPFKEN